MSENITVSPILNSIKNKQNATVNSNIQKVNEEPKVSLEQEPDKFVDNKGEAKEVKNKKTVIIASTVGVIAAAGGFLFLAKKGILGDSLKSFADKIIKPSQKVNGTVPPKTTPQTNNTTNKPQKIIKEFLGLDNNAVENVSFDKGFAKLEDGTGFSGTFKTIDGNGRKIEIEYKDGYMTLSKIDGLNYKQYFNIPSEFSPNDKELSRKNGVLIQNWKGQKINSIQYYNKDGKTKRVLRQGILTKDEAGNLKFNALDSNKEGMYGWQAFDFEENDGSIKMASEAIYDKDLTKILDGKIYGYQDDKKILFGRITSTPGSEEHKIEFYDNKGNSIKAQDYLSDEIMQSVNKPLSYNPICDIDSSYFRGTPTNVKIKYGNGTADIDCSFGFDKKNYLDFMDNNEQVSGYVYFDKNNVSSLKLDEDINPKNIAQTKKNIEKCLATYLFNENAESKIKDLISLLGDKIRN